MSKNIILGSRGSDLALWQAHKVQADLQALGHQVDIKIIKTRGDNIQHLSFDKIEGKGFFTKEIEDALLSKEIDLAVHSHKDLETTNPSGLVVAAVSARENPADLLLIRKEAVDPSGHFMLKAGAVVGTSSARRKTQLLNECPAVTIKDIRGNVPTRLQKLRDGQYDAILLAYAGIKRLELDTSDLQEVVMNVTQYIPAPAQGVLALQIRESDKDLADILKGLNHQNVADCIGVEREILRLFKGGCQLPLGAYCKLESGVFHLWATVADTWDSKPVSVYLSSSNNENLAEEAVAALLAKKKAS